MPVHSQFIDYMEAIAAANKAINHIPGKRVRFARQNVAELKNLNTSAVGPVLQVTDQSGTIAGDSDTMFAKLNVGFVVWVYSDNAHYDKEEAAFDESLRIGFEIIGKIALDAANGCEALTGFASESVNYQMVNIDPNRVGYWFQFNIQNHQSIIEYNQESWQ